MSLNDSEKDFDETNQKSEYTDLKTGLDKKSNSSMNVSGK